MTFRCWTSHCLPLAEVKVATVRSQVALNLFSDFTIPNMSEPGDLNPAEYHHQILPRMLDEVVDWSVALRSVRLRAGA